MTTVRQLIELLQTTPNIACDLDREVVIQIQSPLENGMIQPQYTLPLNHLFTGATQILFVARTDDKAIVLR
jgi:hypothetical protein